MVSGWTQTLNPGVMCHGFYHYVSITSHKNMDLMEDTSLQRANESLCISCIAKSAFFLSLPGLGSKPRIIRYVKLLLTIYISVFCIVIYILVSIEQHI
jgi:hypothetical protein